MKKGWAVVVESAGKGGDGAMIGPESRGKKKKKRKGRQGPRVFKVGEKKNKERGFQVRERGGHAIVHSKREGKKRRGGARQLKILGKKKKTNSET